MEEADGAFPQFPIQIGMQCRKIRIGKSLRLQKKIGGALCPFRQFIAFPCVIEGGRITHAGIIVKQPRFSRNQRGEGETSAFQFHFRLCHELLHVALAPLFW